jgi:hypothetical protein
MMLKSLILALFDIARPEQLPSFLQLASFGVALPPVFQK